MVTIRLLTGVGCKSEGKTLKYLLLCAALMLSVCAEAEPYSYVHAETSYSTLGGATTLTVHLHNNGGKVATCSVEVFNRNKTTRVSAYGDSSVSFDSLPGGAQPRYSCTAD